ncbi:MAG: BTAD domain-containing putative transcriptional regulator [Acidimicrobiales bacterium]
MSRSFRFVPPEPRPDLLPRPRLLRSLSQRWQHRITYLAGGPGLGKTTLLAQAIAENLLAPRGEDLWIAVDPSDAHADRLAHVVATALASSGADDAGVDGVSRGPSVIDPATIADAVWQRAPAEACLVLDDVHLVPPGSTGATWLAGLVDVLPANGHVVFASRADPPVPLSRYRGQGAVLQLLEDELRFSDDELSSFAANRGLEPDRVASTGGWPAMAELAASVGPNVTGSYLWEQVLEPLGPLKRQVLAAVCDLGGADDDLASAALGMRVNLAQVFDGVPLVGRREGGWYVPHSLWRSTPDIVLASGERAGLRRRAATHLVERRWFGEAFTLAEGGELWDAVPGVLRAACLASDRVSAGQLSRWLAACPPEVRDSAAGVLTTAVHASLATPRRADEPLRMAMSRSQAEGDDAAELLAIAHRGTLAWWRQDLDVLAEVTPRLTELAATGDPAAEAMMRVKAALMEDIAGNDQGVLDHLARVTSGVLPPTFEAYAIALSAWVHVDRGQPEAVARILAPVASGLDPALQFVIDCPRLMATWSLGQIDEFIERLPGLLAAGRVMGLGFLLASVLNHASVAFSQIGDVAAAQRLLDEAMVTVPSATGRLSLHCALATAALQLAEGHEAEASRTLTDLVAREGIERGVTRRWWRHTLSLSYILVPEARKHWDGAPLTGHLAIARDLAALVVATHAGWDAPLRTADLPPIGITRSTLHFRHAAELAVGLAAVGRSEGAALLDALGAPGREAVRALANAPGEPKAAKVLLAASPAPPPRSTYLAVLGPLAVRRDGWDGEELVDPDLHRQRIQVLVAYLTSHRHTTRSRIIGALWPDLDERAAGNNLAVTLSRLLRLLEPWRDSRDPSYLVRLDGQAVRLAAGEHLRIDVDEFDDHRAAAAQAEEDGAPSLALDHHLAAVALYRGDLYADVGDGEWISLPREHYRTRFVSSAVRAGQLLLAQGDTDRAEAVAHRALEVDTRAEEAYGVLVGAALARRDRSGAQRLLVRCMEALAELGVEPSESTRQLHRRLIGA